MNKFQMKDPGPTSSILGINIERNDTIGNIKLSQSKYIQDLLIMFNMTNNSNRLGYKILQRKMSKY